MPTITVDYNMNVEDRIAAAKKSLPYIVNIHESVIRNHNNDLDTNRMIFGKREYSWMLFEFPEGTSKKMATYRIQRSGGEPANPAHMLAFAEQAFKDNKSFGKYHSYVIGLGGELQTVLGAQFGGLNTGTCYFFQHVPQHKWTHNGGQNNRFLGVKILSL